jgi:hypothetical protein
MKSDLIDDLTAGQKIAHDAIHEGMTEAEIAEAIDNLSAAKSCLLDAQCKTSDKDEILHYIELVMEAIASQLNVKVFEPPSTDAQLRNAAKAAIAAMECGHCIRYGHKNCIDHNKAIIPINADEAALMCLLGIDYLKKHNPERLTKPKHMETEYILRQAWELSTWAGSINWRGGENQKEWLDDLRELIEQFQLAYKKYMVDAYARKSGVMDCDAVIGPEWVASPSSNPPAPLAVKDKDGNVLIPNVCANERFRLPERPKSAIGAYAINNRGHLIGVDAEGNAKNLTISKDDQ